MGETVTIPLPSLIRNIKPFVNSDMSQGKEYRTLYRYEAQEEDELSLEEGQYVRVVSKQTTDDNWWLCELNGQKGLFPHCFVRREMCQVLHNYQAQDSDELSLQRGQKLAVLDKDVEEGWWKGELQGEIGVFPSSFVEELTDISDSVFKIQDIMKKRRKILNVLENGDHSNLSSLEGLDHELRLECHNWRKLHGRPEDQQELGQSVLQQLVDHDRPEVLLERSHQRNTQTDRHTARTL